MLVAKVPEATTLIAIYAAVLSTASLVWNVYSWFRLNRTKVSVDIDYVDHASAFQNRAAVRIKLVNRGGRPVEVMALESLNSGPKFDFNPQGYGQSLPMHLSPREERTLDFDTTSLVTPNSNYTLDQMLRNGLQVAARLSDGQRFVSKTRKLDVSHRLK